MLNSYSTDPEFQEKWDRYNITAKTMNRINNNTFKISFTYIRYLTQNMIRKPYQILMILYKKNLKSFKGVKKSFQIYLDIFKILFNQGGNIEH